MLFLTLYSSLVFTTQTNEEKQTTGEGQCKYLLISMSKLTPNECQAKDEPTSSTPSENSKQPNGKDDVSSSSEESLNDDDSGTNPPTFLLIQFSNKSEKETSHGPKNESEGEQVAGKSNQTESASKDNPLSKEKPSTERRGADLGHPSFSDEQSEKEDSSLTGLDLTEGINEFISFLLTQKTLGESEGKDSKKEDSSSTEEKEMFNELKQDPVNCKDSQCLKKLKKNECLKKSEKEQEKGPEKDNKNVSFKEEEN